MCVSAISSSSICYNETVNTLRFGHRAKQIIAQPLVNEDPKQKIIRDLKGEVVRLKELLTYHKVSALFSGDFAIFITIVFVYVFSMFQLKC